MKLYIKFASFLLAASLLLTACGDEEEEPVPFETDDEGNYYSINDEGETVPVEVPMTIVYTDEEGNITSFTDENGGEIAYVTDEDERIVTDSSGAYMTMDTTRDPTKPLEGVKVGFIYNGSVSGSTFNKVFEMSRKELERTSGVETAYIENVLVQQFNMAVDTFKEAGFSVIVAASNHFVTACNLAAKNEFDSTKYICYGSPNSDRSQSSIQPMLYQPVNVCGLIAAYNTNTNKIGIVADNNFFNAMGVVSSFALGTLEIRDARIDVSLNWALSDSYDETRQAIDDLVAKGNDVIFLYQSTEYGIAYCEQIGVKCIGFAYNMPELAPNTYLAGYTFNPTNYLVGRVNRVQHETFNSERYIGDLNSGTVMLTTINEELAKEATIDIANTMYEFISSGTSSIFSGEIIDTNQIIRVDKGARLSTDQILSLDWLTNVIGTVTNFSPARTQDKLFFSDLEIRQ